MLLDSGFEAPIHPEATAPAAEAATVVLPFPRQSTWDHSHLRECNRLDGILAPSHEWIASLPPDVRPLRLAMDYPRLVNLIALVWNNRPVASTLLTDLLKDDRGDPDGFPAVLFAELRGLHDHYFNRFSLTQ